jgi:hypothetical protein
VVLTGFISQPPGSEIGDAQFVVYAARRRNVRADAQDVPATVGDGLVRLADASDQRAGGGADDRETDIDGRRAAEPLQRRRRANWRAGLR